MQKKCLVALLLALMLTLSGCALISVDEAKDLAQTIIDVDGETVSKQTFLNQVNYYYQQQYNMYAQYGLEDYFVSSQSSILENIYDTVQQENIRNLVMKHQAAAQGLDKMTEEETQEIETEALNQFRDAVAATYLADSELTGEELRAEAAKYAEENGITSINGWTVEDIQKDVAVQKAQQKLTHSVIDSVTVSDERLQAAMDATDYRLVKHILISFLDSSAVSTAKTAVTTAESGVAAAEADIAAAAEGADMEALNAALASANATLEEAKNALDALVADTKAKADEVYALATAEGADFDALIVEYNEDPGMETNPNGYLISSDNTDFVTEFKDGGMALEKVGDVSEPVETTYGYHIIQYAYDGEAAETRAAVSDNLLSTVQNEALDAAYDAWEAAAKISVFLDRLN